MQTTHNPDWVPPFKVCGASKRTCIFKPRVTAKFWEQSHDLFLFLCFRVSAYLSHAVWFYVSKVIVHTWNAPLQRAERFVRPPSIIPQPHTFRGINATPQLNTIASSMRRCFHTPTNQFGNGCKHRRPAGRANHCSETIHYECDSRSVSSGAQTGKRSWATSFVKLEKLMTSLNGSR